MPLKNEYTKLVQKSSNGGKNFPEMHMHIHIMNLKAWLRGIHHHCSEERLQSYLDEFHFRYNRRNNMESIFDVLMRRIVNADPKRLSDSEKQWAT